MARTKTFETCMACNRKTEHTYLWVKNDSSVLRCAACGLGSSTKGSFDPTAFYVRNYFDGTFKDGYIDYLGSEQVLRDEFIKTIRTMRYIVPSGTLVEI